MPSDKVAELTEYLRGCQVVNGHVPVYATEPPTTYDEAIRCGWQIFSVTMADLVAAPHWFEAGLSLFAAAREYFGGTFPRLYSLNAFWTAPSEELFGGTQVWHRDGDDAQQLGLFMFGTDVLPGDGEHQYAAGSHRDRNLLPPPDEGSVRHIFGPAGTIYIADNNGLHLGVPPRAPRLLVWARWCTSDPPASYVWDATKPISRAVLGDRYPADPELQDAIRLVVC